MRTFTSFFACSIALAFGASASLIPPSGAYAQQPTAGNGPPRGPINRPPDARVEQRTYHFAATDEELPYAVYVSSQVSAAKANPLIVALHGLGGDPNSLLRSPAIELAEQGGYILVGPMGYNPGGWYGSPVIAMGEQPVEPPNLAELSEQDVMNVLAMIRSEFNVDRDRTYLMGHSMGGAGALYLGSKYVSEWAAIASIAPAAFRLENDREAMIAEFEKAGVPVMIVQGAMDTLVPPENTRRWVDTMEAAGLKHEYIEFPNGDHGNVIGDGMAGIFEFFEANSKD